MTLLADIISAISQTTSRTLKEAGPEERKRLVKALSNLTDLGVLLLQESTEFRQAFAKVHNEFLKYPESRETIDIALNAYEEFGPGEVNSVRSH